MRYDISMNKPLLSICIPTYNRAHYLKECLEGLVCQFDDKRVYDQVEVVISDNASTDNTQALVEEYRQKYTNITYFKNKENIGFDLNVVNAVEKASGTYCWYMGDDDTIRNGGIRSVVDFLTDNEIAVLTIGSTSFTSLREITGAPVTLNNAAFRTFPDFRKFFREGGCVGVLSVFVFNRNIWLATTDRNNYILGWLYYESILKIMPETNLKLVYCDYPLVYTKQNCDWVTGGHELFAFLTCKQLKGRMAGFGYEQKMIDEAFGITSKKLIVILLRAKGHELPCSIKNLLRIYRGFREDVLYLPLITFIFFIPNPFIRMVRDFNKKFIKIKT